MAKKKPTLHYYARFKEEFGYLHAVIRSGTTRKCITTPLVITAEQLPRLDTSGYISNPTEGDLLLDGRLHRFTPIVWSVVNPLIANGEFANIPSQTLTAKILEARERDLRDLEQEADLLYTLKTRQNNTDNQNQSQKKTEGKSNG